MLACWESGAANYLQKEDYVTARFFLDKYKSAEETDAILTERKYQNAIKYLDPAFPPSITADLVFNIEVLSLSSPT